MIKTIDLYGKTLEDEITKYYNQNNKSVINLDFFILFNHS